jgi:hypothetical protein
MPQITGNPDNRITAMVIPVTAVIAVTMLITVTRVIEL